VCSAALVHHPLVHPPALLSLPLRIVNPDSFPGASCFSVTLQRRPFATPSVVPPLMPSCHSRATVCMSGRSPMNFSPLLVEEDFVFSLFPPFPCLSTCTGLPLSTKNRFQIPSSTLPPLPSHSIHFCLFRPCRVQTFFSVFPLVPQASRQKQPLPGPPPFLF